MKLHFQKLPAFYPLVNYMELQIIQNYFSVFVDSLIIMLFLHLVKNYFFPKISLFSLKKTHKILGIILCIEFSSIKSEKLNKACLLK
jgi:hypothetical protein